MLPKTVISWIDRWAPSAAEVMRSLLSRWRLRKQFRARDLEYRALLFGGAPEIKVLGGPFGGMRYLDATIWGSIVPKWLGSYESELGRIVNVIAKGPYSQVVVLGSAEGYYTAGLALKKPGIPLHAFEADCISRRQTLQLARLNGVEQQITIHGKCTPENIEPLLRSGRSAVVCDIEGHEMSVLDPAKVSGLRNADILVELHPVSGRQTTEEAMRSRFGDSHTIQKIVGADKASWVEENRPQLPPSLTPTILDDAMREFRDDNAGWLWMTAKPHQG
jgi:hypothetical protein